jgi:uncharacterized membrane protein
MLKPNLYERVHWAVFNGIGRIFGISCCVISFIFCALILSGIFGSEFGKDYPAGLLVLFVPLVIIGFLMVKAKAFYPKKYKEWYEQGRNKNS